MISSVLPRSVHLKQTFPNFMQLVHTEVILKMQIFTNITKFLDIQ